MPVGFPIDAQLHEHERRQRHEPVLVALAVVDVQAGAVLFDRVHLQGQRLREPKAATVDQAQETCEIAAAARPQRAARPPRGSAPPAVGGDRRSAPGRTASSRGPARCGRETAGPRRPRASNWAHSCARSCSVSRCARTAASSSSAGSRPARSASLRAKRRYCSCVVAARPRNGSSSSSLRREGYSGIGDFLGLSIGCAALPPTPRPSRLHPVAFTPCQVSTHAATAASFNQAREATATAGMSAAGQPPRQP